jgi:hypothetical protein
LNQGFRLAVYDLTAVSKVFEDVGLEGLKALLNGLVQGGKGSRGQIPLGEKV